jgi:hypothetical protein
MKTLLSLCVSLLLCVSLAGCFFEKPKPEVKIKRIYIKTKVAKAPPECRAKYAEIKPLPKNSGLNEMTQEVILQRAGRTKDRAGFSVCQTYAQKVSGK